jgi:hypothetical protein
MSFRNLLWISFAPLIACGDVTDPDGEDQGHEDLFTTVELSFQPSTGEARVFRWSDPEVDGTPTIDAITLPDGGTGADHAAATYALGVRFLNSAEDPEHDITPEVAEEGAEHQIFLTGTGVQGPATGDNAAAVIAQAYADADDDGLPIGLEHTVSTVQFGSGELTVTLRHLPPEGDQPVKAADLAEAVAAGGFSAIGGDTDVQVTFPITVE